MWMRAVWVSVLLSIAVSVSAQDVVDRLKVPGPIGFFGETFRLAWTSNPSDRLYKQEYLPAGQTLERYESMLMLDLTFDGATPRQKAAAFAATLDARKSSDPVVNYEVLLGDNGEVILDFLLSATPTGGDLIVEWNAYRYSTLGDGVQMVGISRRAYGDAAEDFLRHRLKALRDRDIRALAALELRATLPAK
ncbi:hypothetical protein [Pseudoxanthomonas japonensis]|uniref:hypothetical protein n=1 Tax=Pseudoxanthomonas japonensis TaxID=69284 RepID=UPI001BCC5255|nr:hypothetical protein [Pseudoxanthomonas japonensis]